MKHFLKFTALLFSALLITAGCSTDSGKEDSQIETDNETHTEISENLVKKPDSWIKNRVAKAKEKLNSTEGGKLVWLSMEAHGGLENYYTNGAISFQFDYVPVGNGTARITTNQVDTWTNKAVHQDVENPENSFGWDGENAWYKRNDTLKFPYDVRFWALTPYTFVGQPFVFDGAGVQVEKLQDQRINGVEYDAVKITYEAGTGDAPDDYYINLYDKETHLLKALKYIVSYPSRFKKGEHSPEKTMVLYDLKTIDGITLPTRYETFKLSEKEGELGEKVTNVKVSKISFLPKLKKEHFVMPASAKITID